MLKTIQFNKYSAFTLKKIKKLATLTKNLLTLHRK